MIDANMFKGLSIKELSDSAAALEQEFRLKGAPYMVGTSETVDYNKQAKNVSDGCVGTNPLQTQVGGGHYKDMPIQPLEYCHANGIGKIEGDVIAYVSRWRKKGGIQDLEKSIHELQILIQLEKVRQESGTPRKP